MVITLHNQKHSLRGMINTRSQVTSALDSGVVVLQTQVSECQGSYAKTEERIDIFYPEALQCCPIEQPLDTLKHVFAYCSK